MRLSGIFLKSFWAIPIILRFDPNCRQMAQVVSFHRQRSAPFLTIFQTIAFPTLKLVLIIRPDLINRSHLDLRDNRPQILESLDRNQWQQLSL